MQKHNLIITLLTGHQSTASNKLKVTANHGSMLKQTPALTMNCTHDEVNTV